MSVESEVMCFILRARNSCEKPRMITRSRDPSPFFNHSPESTPCGVHRTHPFTIRISHRRFAPSPSGIALCRGDSRTARHGDGEKKGPFQRSVSRSLPLIGAENAKRSTPEREICGDSLTVQTIMGRAESLRRICLSLSLELKQMR